MLYDGLDYPTKTTVESLYNGHLQVKPPTTRVYFEEVVENMLEWEPISIDAKKPTTTTTTINKDGMHRINSIFENDVRIPALVRRLEALDVTVPGLIISKSIIINLITR